MRSTSRHLASKVNKGTKSLISLHSTRYLYLTTITSMDHPVDMRLMNVHVYQSNIFIQNRGFYTRIPYVLVLNPYMYSTAKNGLIVCLLNFVHFLNDPSDIGKNTDLF